MLFLLPLALFWFILINHLRVEWSVNPQYAYGWTVPFLCAFLLWRRVRHAKPKFEDQSAPTSSSQRPGEDIFCLFAAVGCAFAYGLTRLIQEANPDWRLVSWALAIEVVVITLCMLRFALRASYIEQFVFPIGFFLVAVPWPTWIEAPLIRFLTTGNTSCTVELLEMLGIPAMRHGNIIELSIGALGVDDACSGIRSLQAAIMLALFLGEFFLFNIRRRGLILVAGVALALSCNVLRTLVLAIVASLRGASAIESWHDDAGVLILIGCFFSLWAFAILLKRRQNKITPQVTSNDTAGQQFPNWLCPNLSTRKLSTCSLILLGWILAIEAGKELWYRSHESRVSKIIPWHLVSPRQAAEFQELPFSEKAKRLLRFDEGSNISWRSDDGARWQAIFLRWNPGRIAAHLAKSHTPEVCLTAAGRQFESHSELLMIPVHGLNLPFLVYVTKNESPPLRVYYCLWDDHDRAETLVTAELTYANRLSAVLAGRRNCGQRSLEIAVAGVIGLADSQASLTHELKKLIALEAPQ
jgi:exosortase